MSAVERSGTLSVLGDVLLMISCDLSSVNKLRDGDQVLIKFSSQYFC